MSFVDLERRFSSRGESLISPSLDYKRVQFSRSDGHATDVFFVKIEFEGNCGKSWRIETSKRESKRIVHCTVVKFLFEKFRIDHPRTVHRARESWDEKYRAVRWRIGKRCGKERHSRVTDTGRWQQTALSGIDRSVVDASPRLPARSEVIRSISVALCLV